MQPTPALDQPPSLLELIGPVVIDLPDASLTAAFVREHRFLGPRQPLRLVWTLTTGSSHPVAVSSTHALRLSGAAGAHRMIVAYQRAVAVIVFHAEVTSTVTIHPPADTAATPAGGGHALLDVVVEVWNELRDTTSLLAGTNQADHVEMLLAMRAFIVGARVWVDDDPIEDLDDGTAWFGDGTAGFCDHWDAYPDDDLFDGCDAW